MGGNSNLFDYQEHSGNRYKRYPFLTYSEKAEKEIGAETLKILFSDWFGEACILNRYLFSKKRHNEHDPLGW